QIDDLVRLRVPGQVQISPDGRWVVYVEKRASLQKNRYFHGLVLADASTGAAREQSAGEHSDTSPCWTPDSRAIVFVSDRGGRENLWRIELRGGEPERLTDLEDACGRRECPRTAAASPSCSRPRRRRSARSRPDANTPARSSGG